MDKDIVKAITIAGASVSAGLLVQYVLSNYHVNGASAEEEWVYNFDDNASGGELLAKVLSRHGVKFIFTLIGGHISPIIVGAEKVGIRVVDVRHESTTVFAADAVGRLTGIPGVAAVTAGPGLTNTITAVKNAQMAQSPVIILGGATSDLLKGRGSLQDIDQFALMRPHVKWMAHVSRVQDIVPMTLRAFKESLSGTPGPVFLEFPIDTLYPQPIATGWYKKNESATTSIAGRITNMYMTYHLNKIFSVYGKDVMIPGPLPTSDKSPTSNSISKTISLLKHAQRPVLVVGAQAMLLGGIEKGAISGDDLQQACQSLGIPIFTSNMARGLMGTSHPRLFRHCRSHALRNADLVILAGVVCDFRLSYGKSIGSKAVIVSVNRDSTDLYKNRRPTYPYQSDPSSFLMSLAKAADGVTLPREAWQPWLHELTQKDIARNTEIAKKASDDSELVAGDPTNPNNPKKFLNPLRALEAFDRHLPQKAVLVADGGDFVASASYIVKPRGPLCWLDPGSFGTLGVGAGFALAAKLVKPDHTVYIVFGDGACGYSIPEYDTFVRHKIAVGAIVGNDACWMQILRDQQSSLHSKAGCNLAYTDYDQVVQSFGGVGFKVDNDKDLEGVLVKAQEILDQQEKPVLINCIIGRTNFRDGSISV